MEINTEQPKRTLAEAMDIMNQFLEKMDADEWRAQVADTERLWQTHGVVSVSMLRRELQVSQARAQQLRKATMPSATVQLELNLPEPPTPKPKPIRRVKAKKQARGAVAKFPKVKGYIYVIRAVDEHYKIGLTVNPVTRLRQLRAGSPHDLAFEILAPCDDIYRIESVLHTQYANQRIKGEWFTLSADDLTDIRTTLGL